eukprot:6371309-Alexandrium_andersonii.AAC.1
MLRSFLGPAQFQVRTPAAMLTCPIHAGAAPFDRFDSLLGSIGTRCTRRRTPPRPPCAHGPDA